MATRDQTPPAPAQYLITTPIRDGHCGLCKALVWHAHCHGVYVQLDPTRISQQAEIGAVLAGVRTFEVHAIGTRRPMLRNRFTYQRWPTRGFVHAAHQCGRIWPDSCRDTRPDMPWLDPDVYARLTTDECPF